MCFKDRIYRAVAMIPKGRVATYGQIAELSGYASTAARAVGNTIHDNTDPVKVPCHRVVRADGRLGSNYGLGGPARQYERLSAEGVSFSRDEGADSVVDLAASGIVIETHPLEPFLPENGRILFLGSFPPPKARWSMEFFYPNWINDFWRIQGLIHFDDPHHFERPGNKSFDKAEIISFCLEQGLAFFDTARKICRLKGNASDEFLHIIEPSDIASFLAVMPDCKDIVTTGGKASEELSAIFNTSVIPEVGGSIELTFAGCGIKWWRMPSSSRAFPMPLAEKAAYYSKLIQ